MPTTNKELKARGHDEMPFGEFLGWFGSWFIAQVHPGRHPRDFFSLKPRDKLRNSVCLRDKMNGKRFERINDCLKLDNEEDATKHRDVFFWIIKIRKVFNDNVDA